MHPTIFELGPITLRSFGLMAALGFAFGYFIMKRRSLKLADIQPENVAQMLVILMFGGAFGARIAYVIEHWNQEFAGKPLYSLLRFDQGGLMFYGGFIGAIIALTYFARLTRRNLIGVLDLAALALPLGHAFGRIGCFLNGCCYGKISQSFIAVSYPAGSNPWIDQVHSGEITNAAQYSLPIMPSQLIEATLNFILFAALWFVSSKKINRGLISGIYLISYSIIRTFTETLRSDPRAQVGIFSIAQFISIFIFLAGIGFIVYALKAKSNRSDSDKQ